MTEDIKNFWSKSRDLQYLVPTRITRIFSPNENKALGIFQILCARLDYEGFLHPTEPHNYEGFLYPTEPHNNEGFLHPIELLQVIQAWVYIIASSRIPVVYKVSRILPTQCIDYIFYKLPTFHILSTPHTHPSVKNPCSLHRPYNLHNLKST